MALIRGVTGQAAGSTALLENPLTTGAVFIVLTGAIAYLYRARDADRTTETTRLEKQIARLEERVEALMAELTRRRPDDD